jgi:hypothetical protein
MDVTTLTWNSGNVVVTGAAGTLRAAGAITVKAVAGANQQVSGTVDLQAAGSVVVEASSRLSLAGATITAGTGITLAASAALQVQYSTSTINSLISYGAATAQTTVDTGATLLVTSANTISGTGKTVVSGTLETSAALTHAANAEFQSGTMRASGTAGQVNIAVGSTFDFKAGQIQSTSTASSAFVVGHGTGTGQASLRFSGTTETRIQGVFEVRSAGVMEIMTSSSARASGSTTVRGGSAADGTGKFIVRTGGVFTADATTDIQVPMETDGTVTFRPGIQVNLNSMTVQTRNAFTNFAASASGFQVVTAGNVQLNGAVNVDLGTFTTETRVKIMTCARLTGQFTTQSIVKASSVTIENATPIRTLAKAKGAVAIEGNDLYYDPTADPNNPPINRSAASTVVPSVAFLLPSLLLAIVKRM